jgi:hypothetical protein
MNPGTFFAELKRRNVYKVAVAYAIVGWLAMQIATQIFPFLEIPNWVVRLVIVLVVSETNPFLEFFQPLESLPGYIGRHDLN